MSRTYIPKKSFFQPTRIHKIAKDLMEDCREDRGRALETFKYFRELIDVDSTDDKAKAEMIHALGLSQDANDKIVKILEMMIKMTQTEQKAETPKDGSNVSFEDFRKVRK
jgi:hypothetical protein